MRILLVLCLWLGLNQSLTAKQIPVTVYADDAYPPYSFASEEKAKGIYSDIMRLAFSRMPRYNVTIKPTPFKRGLKLLEAGRAFALYPPYFYPNQRQYINPYSVPILQEEVVVYCNTKPPVSTSWPDDFYGLKIGINNSFAIGGEQFWIAEKEDKITIEPALDNRENILKLKTNRIDCYINDKLSILWEIKRMKLSGDLDEDREFELSISVSTEQGYLAFSADADNRYPYKEHFVKKFNAIILEMQNNGEINNLLNRYID